MAWIDDELVIKGEIEPAIHAVSVIELRDLLAAIGERAISDIYARAAVREVADLRAREPAKSNGRSNLISWPTPQRARRDNAHRKLAIDIRIVDRLIAPVEHAGPQKSSKPRHELLLNVDAAACLQMSLAQILDAWREVASSVSERDNLVIFAQIAVVAVDEKMRLSRLTPKFISTLKFGDAHELTSQHWFDLEAIGNFRKLEEAAAQSPPILPPFEGCAVGVAPQSRQRNRTRPWC